MNANLAVGLAAVVGTLAVALLLVGAGKLADRRRGLSAEESRQSGLMSQKGSSPASFGDFRHLPGDDDLTK